MSPGAKALLKYGDKLFEDFQTNFEKVSVQADVEPVHQIRRVIKRLRTFYRFIEGFDPAEFNSKKNYNVLKNLFKQSGVLREIQLNTCYIDKYEIPENVRQLYKKYFLRMSPGVEEGVRTAVQNFRTDEFEASRAGIMSVCSRLTSRSIKDEAVRFIIRETGKIKIRLAMQNTSANIHEIRKHFKFLVIIFQILQLLKSVSHLKKVLKTLKHTEEFVGQWHDKIVLQNSISVFLKSVRNPALQRFKPLKDLSANLKRETSDSMGEVISKISAALGRIEY